MVRRLLWAGGILAAVIVVALAGVAVYVARTWDRVYDAPLPEVKSFVGVMKPRTIINPPQTAPPQGATRESGEYLARYVANCVGCHTPRDPNTFAATGPEFSGGFEMEPIPIPGVDQTIWFRTPNITPAPGSALMKFPDLETFMARFQKGGRQHAGSSMPWEAFARMTTEDIAALHEYLHSLQPEDGPTGEPTFTKTD